MGKHVMENNRIFSPTVVNWIVALFAGVCLPLISQNWIAKAISNLSTTPTLIDDKIVQISEQEVGVAGIILIVVAFIYLIFVAYQIRFIAILKTHASVFAFTITTLTPFVIWIGLPFVLQSFNS